MNSKMEKLAGWAKTAWWLFLTGGFNSELLRIPEHTPYRVVRAGGRLIVDTIPTQREDPPQWFQPGQSVKVLEHAGFHRGAIGVVKYHAPDGRVWVRRVNSSSDVFYYPHELEEVAPPCIESN